MINVDTAVVQKVACFVIYHMVILLSFFVVEFISLKKEPAGRNIGYQVSILWLQEMIVATPYA